MNTPVKRLYYCSEVPNLGDIANPLLLEELFGCRTREVYHHHAELFAIGSILQKVVQKNPSLKRRIMKNFKGELTVWSSGFIDEPTVRHKPVRKLRIAALRGERTKQAMERILQRPLHVPVGDAGLLFNRLIDRVAGVKYSVGIIPHFNESDDPFFGELAEKIPGAHIISVLGDVRSVLREIASCEVIVSSSLHGLISADAFGIPNLRIRSLGKIKGGDFKFDDYYSAFGLESSPYAEKADLLAAAQKGSFPNFIADRYKITPSKVEEIRNELLKAWPF